MNKQVKVAKELAKHLTAALSKNGQDLSHGVALEVVAKAMGARNWHAFLAEQQSAPVAVVVPGWSPAHGPMSNEQYVAHEANACPVCGCPHDMESAAFESDGMTAWREVGCHSCSSVWNENFSLTGWSLVKRHDGASTHQDVTDIGFLHAVHLWLADGKEDFEDQQMVLDDLVHDFQIANASSVNNEGPLSQLQHLLKESGSRDQFLAMLAEQCEVPLDKLKL